MERANHVATLLRNWELAYGGFDRCPVCQGWGFLPIPEGACGVESQEEETRASLAL